MATWLIGAALATAIVTGALTWALWRINARGGGEGGENDPG